MAASLTANQDASYEQFTTEFFSVDDKLTVTEEQRQQALRLAHQADKNAALHCMTAFGNTDFRDDLAKVTVPTLVLHGDGDATVPFEGSGARTHVAILSSELVVLRGAVSANCGPRRAWSTRRRGDADACPEGCRLTRGK